MTAERFFIEPHGDDAWLVIDTTRGDQDNMAVCLCTVEADAVTICRLLNEAARTG